MSEELEVGARLKFSKGKKSEDVSFGSVILDVSGSEYVTGTFTPSGTSAEAIPMGGVNSIGYILVRNLDATNYADLHNGMSGTLTVRVGPGEIALFKMTTSGTPYITSNTAATAIEYTFIEA